MIYTTEQEHAMSVLLQGIKEGRQNLTMAGPAGSGKTTITKEIIARIQELYPKRNLLLMSPTGAAASRLSEVTGQTVHTVHKRMYRIVTDDVKTGNPLFFQPGPVADGSDIVICDEAGMVSKREFDNVITYAPRGMQVIWIGDREQLPPVKGGWGPPIDDPDALLETVHRQDGASMKLKLATWVRQQSARKWSWSDAVREVGLPTEPGSGEQGYDALLLNRASYAEAAEWMGDALGRGLDAALMTYTHKVRKILNKKVKAIAQGEHTQPVQEGDLVVCLRNNYAMEWMNGEVDQVQDVEQWEVRGLDVTAVRVSDHGTAQRWALIPPGLSLEADKRDYNDFLRTAPNVTRELAEARDLTPKDFRADWIMMRLGYCRTIHSCQGQEHDHVGIFTSGTDKWLQGKDPETYRRLIYTGITRAQRSLVIFNH